MEGETIEETVNGDNIKAKLTISLIADGVVVAKSNDVDLWTKVLASIIKESTVNASSE